MNHEEFIEQVRLRDHLGDRREEADTTARATSESLAEQLPEREARELDDRLPPGIADHLKH